MSVVNMLFSCLCLIVHSVVVLRLLVLVIVILYHGFSSDYFILSIVEYRYCHWLRRPEFRTDCSRDGFRVQAFRGSRASGLVTLNPKP